jgi:hypothetical protein
MGRFASITGKEMLHANSSARAYNNAEPQRVFLCRKGGGMLLAMSVSQLFVHLSKINTYCFLF